MLEYDNHSNYLSQYAPLEVANDDVKCLKFKNGLSLVIQDKLSITPYKDFNDLVSLAITTEHKRNVLEDNTCKRVTSSSHGGSPTSKVKMTMAPPRILSFAPP